MGYFSIPILFWNLVHFTSISTGLNREFPVEVESQLEKIGRLTKKWTIDSKELQQHRRYYCLNCIYNEQPEYNLTVK